MSEIRFKHLKLNWDVSITSTGSAVYGHVCIKGALNYDIYLRLGSRCSELILQALITL